MTPLTPDAPDADLPEPPIARDPRQVGDDDPPGGLFRSWGGLYLTLIVYGVVCIVVLYILTLALNVTIGPGMGPDVGMEVGMGEGMGGGAT